jgi:enamine deaminase RidA (YjgF/YER057c/UK114 family)
MELGEMDKAEEAFMAYAEITRRLIVQQPKNAEWVLEMAYALTNLGGLQQERDANNPERTLQLMQSALEYNQIALVLDPQNEYYQSELGQSHAFLADAQLGVCDLEGALLSRQKNVSLERDMLALDSGNVRKMRRLAWALSGLASVQEQMGSVALAAESIEEALQQIAPVLSQNPEDRKSIRLTLDRKERLIRLTAFMQDPSQTSRDMDALNEDWQLYFQTAVTDDFDANEAYAVFLINRARLAREDGAPELAEKFLNEGMAVFLNQFC